MSGSTLVVAINALMLKRTRLAGIPSRKKATTAKADKPSTPTSAEASALPENPKVNEAATA